MLTARKHTQLLLSTLSGVEAPVCPCSLGFISWGPNFTGRNYDSEDPGG
jgi:hypothetical protein